MDKGENRSQAIGLSYSPRLIKDPLLVGKIVEEASEKHFSLVIGFIRRMRQSVLSPAVVKAVKKSADIAHKYGLKFVLDMDPHFWGAQFVEENPDAVLWIVRRAEAITRKGRFDAWVKLPGIPERGQEIFREVSSAYKISAQGKATYLNPSSLDIAWENARSFYGLPDFEDVPFYDYYRDLRPTSFIKIRGQLKDGFSGKVVLYVAIAVYSNVDLTSPQYLKAQKKLLDLYRNVPLDGIGWDEPGKGASLDSYKAGEAFFRLFKKTKGYDLKKELIFLDDYGYSPHAVKVRYDYYEVLSGALFRAQKEFNSYAKRLFGKNIFLGTHHTWSGITCDLRAGCFDYFKLAKNCSAAFTDCNWTDLRFVAYNYLLVDSLKKAANFELSYCNDWCGVTTRELMNFYTRLKMLFNINWFNIFLGEFSESLPNYPQSHLWKTVGENVLLLDRFNEFAGKDFYPYSSVAVWHGWEGMTCLNNLLVPFYYTFLLNTSKELLEKNVYADFLSTPAVENSTVFNGRLRAGNLSYDTLIVPFAFVLTKKMYRKVQAMIESGLRVIFTGPAPERIVEAGKDISRDFSGRLGIQRFDINSYITFYLSKKPKLSPGACEPRSIDFIYPVKLTGSSSALRDSEDRVYCVKNKRRQLYYFPGLDPKGDLVNLLQSFQKDVVHNYSGTGYYRVYRNNKNDDFLLVTISRMNECLNCVFKINGHELRATGGKWLALKFSAGKVISHLADNGVKWQWKGLAGSAKKKRS